MTGNTSVTITKKLVFLAVSYDCLADAYLAVDPEKFVAFLTEYVQEPFPHNAMYIAYYCVGVDILELNEDFELEEESPCIMGIDVMETEDVSHLVNLKVFPGGDMCFTDEVAKRDTPFFTLEELQQLLV